MNECAHHESTGSPSEVGNAYAELRTSLLAYLRKHVGDPQAAEDLLHDVVIKALAAGRDTAHAPRHLTAWLYGVARNAAVDFHRRQRMTDPLSDEVIDGLAHEEQDDAQAAIEALANCLRPMAERLPPTYRDVVVAAELQGMPLRAVAAAQGVSIDAVKQRASRGRRLLQAELVRCCSVALASNGQVQDYDPTAVAACQPCSPDCKGR